MPVPRDCPELDRWQDLLGDTLSPEQRERYERHLESCPACQERLDRAEACGEPLRQLVRRAGDPTAAPADPSLVHVMERLHEVRSPLHVDEPADLYFLRPAARPRILGTLREYEVEEVIGQGPATAERLVRRWGVPMLLLLAAVGVTLWLNGGRGVELARPRPFQEYVQSFKGPPADRRGLALEGPDADQYVRFTPDGLRITLPAGHPGERRGTGLSIAGPVRGDFEITLRFEILDEPDAIAPGAGPPGLSLDAGVDRRKPIVATLSRQVVSTGRRFLTWMSLWNETAGKNQTQGHGIATQAKTGRLRLVRKGTTVSYHVSEGADGDFTQVRQLPFVGDELEDIRIVASTGSREASLDVRVTDLHILAQALPELPVAGPPDAPANTGSIGSKPWLVVALAISVTLMLSFGLWRVVRRQHATAAPAALDQAQAAFPCSACGKKLKAGAELAGKNVRCPGCGNASIVPDRVIDTAVRSAPARRWLLSAASLILVAAAVALAAWYFWPPAERPNLLNVTLGSALVNGVEESGFHNQEFDGKGQPFRWTDGHGKLVIPIDKTMPPQALQMEIHVIRPPGTAGRLRVLVNRVEFFHGEIPRWQWQHTFDLAGVELGEEVVVEIVSDTFVPRGVMDGGTSTDPRTLGVQVWCVKLLGPADEAKDPPAPQR